MKIAVLASAYAFDLQPVIDAIENRKLDAKISVLISDKADAYALKRAEKHHIPAVFINPGDKTREEFDSEIIKEIEDRGEVNLILLIGYMRILSPNFVRKYKNQVMNIHPSLLPAFAGGVDKKIHEAILRSGIKITGCTLHFIDEGVDSGPIILQKAVEVAEDETIDTLTEKVQQAEQQCIMKGIELFRAGKLKVEDKRVRILS